MLDNISEPGLYFVAYGLSINMINTVFMFLVMRSMQENMTENEIAESKEVLELHTKSQHSVWFTGWYLVIPFFSVYGLIQRRLLMDKSDRNYKKFINLFIDKYLSGKIR